MLEQDERKKTARLEARLTPVVYALVQRAATLQGRSVSDFVVAAAQEAAQATIEQRELLGLSQQDQERFAAAMLQASLPTAAMEEAAEAHRQLIEPS